MIIEATQSIPGNVGASMDSLNIDHSQALTFKAMTSATLLSEAPPDYAPQPTTAGPTNTGVTGAENPVVQPAATVTTGRPPAGSATEFYAVQKAEQNLQIRGDAVRQAIESIVTVKGHVEAAAGTEAKIAAAEAEIQQYDEWLADPNLSFERKTSLQNSRDNAVRRLEAYTGGPIGQIDIDQAELHLVNAQLDYFQAGIELNTARLNYKVATGELDPAKVEVLDASYQQGVYQKNIIPATAKAEALANNILAQANTDVEAPRVLRTTGALNIVYAEEAIATAQLARADAQSKLQETQAVLRQDRIDTIRQEVRGESLEETPSTTVDASETATQSTPDVNTARAALETANHEVDIRKSEAEQARLARQDAKNFERIFHGPIDIPEDTESTEGPEPLLRGNRANMEYFSAQIRYYEALITQNDARVDLQLATGSGENSLTPAEADLLKTQFRAQAYEQAIIPLATKALGLGETVLDQVNLRDGMRFALASAGDPVGLTDVSSTQAAVTELKVLLGNAQISLAEAKTEIHYANAGNNAGVTEAVPNSQVGSESVTDSASPLPESDPESSEKDG